MRNLDALISIAALLLASSAAATTIHVPDDQPTIAAGLAAAAAGDTVLVACGEYYESGLILPSGVTLRAAETSCAWIFGQGQGRLISGASLAPGTRVEGFVLTGGSVSAGGNGGALSFSEGTIEIRDCLLATNFADYKGGGIWLYNCVAIVERCGFQGNVADNGGGGGLAANGGELALRDSYFDGNGGIDGGGILLANCAPLIEACVFVRNDAWFWGGAVMLNGNASPTLRNCTLAGNDAYDGGGLWGCYDSAPVLENCIIAFSTDGAGLFAAPDNFHPTVITLSCCDVYGNVGGGYDGDLEDQTGLNGNFASNPLFCDLWGPDGGNLSLAAGSPCLPGGNDCGVLIGARGQGCEYPTAVPAVPARAALLPNWPNPFNPSTELRFSLSAAGPVTLAIHDLAGRCLRRLLDGAERAAGEQGLRWDGRDDAGRALPSGIYLVRLEAAGLSLSRKLTLLK
jgi:hypothetical protein